MPFSELEMRQAEKVGILDQQPLLAGQGLQDLATARPCSPALARSSGVTSEIGSAAAPLDGPHPASPRASQSMARLRAIRTSQATGEPSARS